MSVEICPQCGGRGWVVVSVMAHGCDGTEKVCSRICPVEEPTQEPCPVCDATGFYENNIQVTPNLYQSLADYQANQEYDEMIDDELVPYQLANEEPNDNPVY